MTRNLVGKKTRYSWIDIQDSLAVEISSAEAILTTNYKKYLEKAAFPSICLIVMISFSYGFEISAHSKLCYVLQRPLNPTSEKGSI